MCSLICCVRLHICPFSGVEPHFDPISGKGRESNCGKRERPCQKFQSERRKGSLRRTFKEAADNTHQIIPADWFAAAFLYIYLPSNFGPATFHLFCSRRRKILSSPIKSQSYRRGHASANSHPRKHTHTRSLTTAIALGCRIYYRYTLRK